MVWSTRQLDRDRDYVVILHKLRDTEGMIEGVRFRAGYGVVDKQSKTYSRLKKLPFLKDGLEFPLEHLKNLKFIIRDRDVETVYGKDVYVHYVRALVAHRHKQAEEEKIKQQEQHLESENLCKYRLDSGELCKNEKHEVSPGEHCLVHLLQDPMLDVLEVHVPTRLSKDEKKEWRTKVIKKLTKLKSEGAF